MAAGKAAAAGVPAVGPVEGAEDCEETGAVEEAGADVAKAVPREWLAQEAEREGGGTPPTC